MEGTSEDLGELRCWDKLVPDVLGLIFSRLSLVDVLTLVPRICKSWREVTLGPHCWQDIDIYDWSLLHRSQKEVLDRMLEILVIRSNGCCRKLCISGLPNDFCFSLIANQKSLQMLRLPRGEMSESIVVQLADRLLNLTYLDLSYCTYIGKAALEAFGKHCKSLSTLVRLIPLQHEGSQDEEAYAIAATMPKLNHLEIGYMHITAQSCLAILSRCRQLKYLDIRGCWDVKRDDVLFMQKKYANLKVVGPYIEEFFLADDWDDDSYESDVFLDDYSCDYSYGSDVFLDDFDDFFDMEGYHIE